MLPENLVTWPLTATIVGIGLVIGKTIVEVYKKNEMPKEEKDKIALHEGKLIEHNQRLVAHSDRLLKLESQQQNIQNAALNVLGAKIKDMQE